MGKEYLNEGEKAALLALAWDSLRHGLAKGRAPRVDLAAFTGNAAQPGSCFVTLKRKGRLRGCIGSLMPHQALAQDVADNAVNAALKDPRFMPLKEEELGGLGLSVSVLTPLQPMDFKDEPDLLSQMRPGQDGLLLEDGRNRGFFLPAVWSEVPDPAEFLTHLKHKAGLPAGHWSPRVKVSRCESVQFGDPD